MQRRLKSGFNQVYIVVKSTDLLQLGVSSCFLLETWIMCFSWLFSLLLRHTHFHLFCFNDFPFITTLFSQASSVHTNQNIGRDLHSTSATNMFCVLITAVKWAELEFFLVLSKWHPNYPFSSNQWEVKWPSLVPEKVISNCGHRYFYCPHRGPSNSAPGAHWAARKYFSFLRTPEWYVW